MSSRNADTEPKCPVKCTHPVSSVDTTHKAQKNGSRSCLINAQLGLSVPTPLIVIPNLRYVSADYQKLIDCSRLSRNYCTQQRSVTVADEGQKLKPTCQCYTQGTAERAAPRQTSSEPDFAPAAEKLCSQHLLSPPYIHHVYVSPLCAPTTSFFSDFCRDAPQAPQLCLPMAGDARHVRVR